MIAKKTTKIKSAEPLQISPLGFFKSDLNEISMNKKISSPRQSGLHRGQSGVITLKAKYREGLQDLQDFNYVWIIFHFHLNTTWKPLVLPPRSTKKRGVFATRSPYRPNPLGISCVQIKKIDGLKIHIADSDLIDGTPIFDIKPYLAYCDSMPDASPGWTQEVQGTAFTINFSAAALKKTEWLQRKAKISLK
ncbi:MAG: tRNA (N6-threonylcarbamoyladenosine(37)-N6)-methyltransferase TrmO, partial [Pseudobdellovibrionaceae bacterium]